MGFPIGQWALVQGAVLHSEYVGHREYTRIGIETCTVSCIIVDAGTYRSIDTEVSELLLISKQNIPIRRKATWFTVDVTTVSSCSSRIHTTQHRAGTCIHTCIVLVYNIVGTTTSLYTEQVIELILHTQIQQCTITGILIRNLINQPIGILLHISTLRFIPVLVHYVTTGIKNLIIIFVVVKVLSTFNTTTREVIKTYQRIHVITSRSSTVVPPLIHRIDIGINSQFVIEEVGSFAKIEIMLHQAITFHHALAVSISIGKVSLHSLRTHAQRERVDSSDTCFEEIVCIVGTTFDITAPTGWHTRIVILEFGNTVCSYIESGAGIETDTGASFLALLSGNNHHTIGSRTTVKCSCGRAFQYVHALNIIGIQIGNTVATVVVTTVVVSADSSWGIFVGRWTERYTVYHIQRLVTSAYRTVTTNNHFRRTSQTGRTLINLHTCRLTGQCVHHIGVFHACQFITVYYLSRVSQWFFFLCDTQCRYHHFIQQLGIIL